MKSLSAGHCIVAGSPQRNGNSDTAATLVQEVLLQEYALPGRIWRVADFLVQPCNSCGHCFTQPGECSLTKGLKNSILPEGEDQAMALLKSLYTEQTACLVSPIYFYHFPAQVKALLDRSQIFWTQPRATKPGLGKKLGAILIGSRARGDKLFSGAILTLKYVCETLGMELMQPLLLYGLEEPDALRLRPDLQEEVRTYARHLYHVTCE